MLTFKGIVLSLDTWTGRTPLAWDASLRQTATTPRRDGGLPRVLGRLAQLSLLVSLLKLMRWKMAVKVLWPRGVHLGDAVWIVRRKPFLLQYLP